jgi:16S rRNA (uracil1498-N3)-methyltransferase
VSFAVFVVPVADLAGDTIAVGGDEGRHAAKVRRVRVGEQIVLTDGRGAGAVCTVREVYSGGLRADVVDRVHEPDPRPSLTVVQAIPKGEHADRAVDLLTEVGVDRIVPWAAERNVVSWRSAERRDRGVERWRAVARAAAKQSRRLRFPEVCDLHATAGVAELARGASLALVLHESAARSPATVDVPADGDVVVVVGPEGGITDEEIAALTSAGAIPIRLGPTVLRSSSAGGAAAAVILSRTRRWT